MQALQQGRFRRDLFHQLAAQQLQTPNLREHPGDLSLLAEHFAKQHGAMIVRHHRRFSEEAITAMISHPWPGNVRELKSCIMRAMLLCENEIIDVEDLQLSQSALTEEALDFDEQERKINRERILWALKQCNGIKRDAAKMLEMSHTTFYARMK